MLPDTSVRAINKSTKCSDDQHLEVPKQFVTFRITEIICPDDKFLTPSHRTNNRA